MEAKRPSNDIHTCKNFEGRRGKQKQYFVILVAKHDVRKSSFLKVRAGNGTRSMKKVGFPYKEHRPQFGWLAGWLAGGLAGWRVGWLIRLLVSTAKYSHMQPYSARFQPDLPDPLQNP